MGEWMIKVDLLFQGHRYWKHRLDFLYKLWPETL